MVTIQAFTSKKYEEKQYCWTRIIGTYLEDQKVDWSEDEILRFLEGQAELKETQ